MFTSTVATRTPPRLPFPSLPFPSSPVYAYWKMDSLCCALWHPSVFITIFNNCPWHVYKAAHLKSWHQFFFPPSPSSCTARGGAQSRGPLPPSGQCKRCSVDVTVQGLPHWEEKRHGCAPLSALTHIHMNAMVLWSSPFFQPYQTHAESS